LTKNLISLHASAQETLTTEPQPKHKETRKHWGERRTGLTSRMCFDKIRAAELS